MVGVSAFKSGIPYESSNSLADAFNNPNGEPFSPKTTSVNTDTDGVQPQNMSQTHQDQRQQLQQQQQQQQQNAMRQQLHKRTVGAPRGAIQGGATGRVEGAFREHPKTSFTVQGLGVDPVILYAAIAVAILAAAFFIGRRNAR